MDLRPLDRRRTELQGLSRVRFCWLAPPTVALPGLPATSLGFGHPVL